MQGEGQGPEGPKQLVALTSALAARMVRSPHPPVGRGGAEKPRCGFLLPVAVVDVIPPPPPLTVYFSHATKMASGRPEVCSDLAYCQTGGSQGAWRKKLYVEGTKRQFWMVPNAHLAQAECLSVGEAP